MTDDQHGTEHPSHTWAPGTRPNPDPHEQDEVAYVIPSGAEGSGLVLSSDALERIATGLAQTSLHLEIASERLAAVVQALGKRGA